MAVVAPMLVNSNSHRGSTDVFSSLHHGPYTTRRGSSDLSFPHVSSQPIVNREPREHQPRERQLTSLENLAARIEQQAFLEDTDSAVFSSYCDSRLYGGSTEKTPYLSKRSRSLPSSYYKTERSEESSKSPLRKVKSVKFADTYGLPLVEAVHHLSNKDSSYTANKIVPYADEDLLSKSPLILGSINIKTATSSSSESSSQSVSPPKYVLNQGSSSPTTHKHVFSFTLPSLEPDFMNRVRRDIVVLESAREEPRILHGIIRVSNLAYEKEVAVRWTHDNWRTSHDTFCVFCSCDGDTDRFAFELPINGDDVSFAVRYRVSGKDYWDNNRGSNYTIFSRPLVS